MKNIYGNFSLLCAAAALLTGMVSCEETQPDEQLSPSFPECVTESDIAPGTELTLTVTPNMAWEITIPKESYGWFQIMDGKFQRASLSGVSSETPLTITIATTDKESFDIRTCEVTMTMGGESQVIAKYSLAAKEKVVTAYSADRDETDGRFIFSDGGYVYETEEISAPIELVWDSNERRFYYPLKVVSNFEWKVSFPDWLRADITAESRVGSICFEIYGVPSLLPADRTEGEISFMSGDDVKKTYEVVIPGCEDKFDFNLSGYTELNFDHAGYFHTDSGASSLEPVQGSFFGPEASRLVVLELTETGYAVTENPWLDLTVSAWDSVEGASVLQTRSVSVSAPRYAQADDRSAILLFLPATAPEIDKILSDDKSGVKDEWASYAVSVLQKGRPAEYLTFEESEAVMKQAGISFSKASGLLADKGFEFAEGTSGWQYSLTYEKEMAAAKSALYITEAYDAIEIYDAAGIQIAEENLSEHWLSYSDLGGLYGQVMMDATKIKPVETGDTDEDGNPVLVTPSEIDGYVVFKDAKGKVLSIVHCFYRQEVKTDEDVLNDVSAELFVDPAAAAAAGASINEVISGPTYEKHKESGAPTYILTYTKDDTILEVKTSEELFLYMYMGKFSGPFMAIVDEQNFEETSGYILEWDDKKNAYIRPYKGTTFIRMKMPESSEENVMEEVLQFNSSMDSNSRVMNIICVLDLSASGN